MMRNENEREAVDKFDVSWTLTGKNINDFNAFSEEYVRNLNANNVLLERVVNCFLQQEGTEQTLIDEMVRACGEDYFVKFSDGTYAWNGIK